MKRQGRQGQRVAQDAPGTALATSFGQLWNQLGPRKATPSRQGEGARGDPNGGRQSLKQGALTPGQHRDLHARQDELLKLLFEPPLLAQVSQALYSCVKGYDCLCG